MYLQYSVPIYYTPIKPVDYQENTTKRILLINIVLLGDEVVLDQNRQQVYVSGVLQ